MNQSGTATSYDATVMMMFNKGTKRIYEALHTQFFYILFFLTFNQHSNKDFS